MKKRNLLVFTLIASTLLAGCDDDTFVSYDKEAKVATVADASENNYDAVLKIQDYYTRLKESNGGTVALDSLLVKLARIEYTKDPNSETKVEIKDSFENVDGKFNVKNYRTNASFKKEIQEKFEDIIDGQSYVDDEGEFDAVAYNEYVTDTLNYKAPKIEGEVTGSFYLDDATNAKLGYNYDEYIEKSIIPSMLQNYLYVDYLTGSSKYKGQFASQYATKLEVLKVPYDTTSLNYSWSQELVSVVRKVTSGASKGTDYKFKSSYNPNFVTFNSNNDLIVYTVTEDAISYNVYKNEGTNEAIIKGFVDTLYTFNDTSDQVVKVTYDQVDAQKSNLTLDSENSWVIDKNTNPDADFYKHIEQVLIARELWKIDREVVLARNYDYKNVSSYYDSLTSSEKSECETFSSTYSSSNSKPMRDVVKEKKISAQQNSYYTEPEYYTKANISNVLCSTLSSLRGTNAKDLTSHLMNFDADASTFLVNKSTASDPVYLDTSSSYYYVCEVSEYYGYYLNENPLVTSSKSLSKVNYQIEAYQAGEFSTYKATYKKDEQGQDTSEVESYNVDTTVKYADNAAAFESIIELVQVSADQVLSDSIKKEAIVSLFEQYALEINDQDVYDYIKSKYPDYFDTDDDED